MQLRFKIRAKVSVDTLPYLIKGFSTHGLIPSRIGADQLGDVMTVKIDHPAIDQATAQHIREYMQRYVQVESVEHWSVR